MQRSLQAYTVKSDNNAKRKKDKRPDDQRPKPYFPKADATALEGLAFDFSDFPFLTPSLCLSATTVRPPESANVTFVGLALFCSCPTDNPDTGLVATPAEETGGDAKGDCATSATVRNIGAELGDGDECRPSLMSREIVEAFRMT